MAGAGTAVGVAALALPNSASAEDLSLPSGAEGSMAAYIHDLTKGQLAIMIEGHEVIMTDKKLVARLARAFAQAEKA